MRIRTAYIEITNQCNFDCATCYNRSGQNLETLELSPTQVRGMVAPIVGGIWMPENLIGGRGTMPAFAVPRDSGTAGKRSRLLSSAW